MTPEELPSRISEKISVCEKTGCWLWTAAKFSSGYGMIGWEGRTSYAHRVVYELVNGPIPEHDSHHGMCVLHVCDVRNCTNPAHLFLGTNADNVIDRNTKGRQAHQRGTENGNAKLTDEQVREIRALRGIERQIDIAVRFGIANGLVSDIQTRKRWKHVE